MVFFIIIFILSLVFSVYTGQVSNFIIPLFFYTVGQVLVRLLSDSNNRITYSKLYGIAYFTFFVYAAICYFFMVEHGFNCLLATDTITSYIPAVKDFMNLESWKDGFSLLYGSFSSQAYSHAGIILFYWAAVGKFSMLFGNELYFNIQISVLFLSAFVPIFLYRLLSQNGIKDPFRYSLIYVICSVFFYYSSLILRDAPIALFYMIAFSYLFSNEQVKKHFVFILLIAVTYLIRPQNGFFLLLFYLISFFSNKKTRTSVAVVTAAAIIISYISIRLDIIEALERNMLYAEMNIDQETEGFINMLDKLPPIISDVSKTIYIHISPIPVWFFMGFKDVNESNNIMTFPRMIGVIYNFIVLGGVVYGVLRYRKFKFDVKKTLVFLAAFLYLLLQTSSTEQRRIMICYPLIFLFALVVYQNISYNKKKTIIQLSMLLFILVQMVALTRVL